MRHRSQREEARDQAVNDEIRLRAENSELRERIALRDRQSDTLRMELSRHLTVLRELRERIAQLESEKAALIQARNELQRTLFGPVEVKR